MNRAALLRRFRSDVSDDTEPYLWSDEWFYDALDDAIQEACVRARLLYAVREPDVCYVEVEVDKAIYPLHPSIYELTDVRLNDRPVRLVSTEWLDDTRPDWRAEEGWEVQFAVQDDTRLRLVPTPKQPGELVLEGYRLPLTLLADGKGEDEPAIHRGHHRLLLEWVKYLAYTKPDTDSMDLERAGLAERAFTLNFGTRPSSDLRRGTRQDADHHSKAYP